MVETIERDTSLPGSLKEALDRGYELFEDTEDQNFSLREDRQIAKKYLDCTPNSDGQPCGETLCFNGRKRIYVCTNGNCYLRGYYTKC